jgi:hypothetical protein
VIDLDRVFLQEFLMNTQDIVEIWRREAFDEGRAKARADDVLTALRVRGIAVPEAARKRILAQSDLQRLEHWLERPSSLPRSVRCSTTELRSLHRRQVGPQLMRNAADAGRHEYPFRSRLLVEIAS